MKIFILLMVLVCAKPIFAQYNDYISFNDRFLFWSNQSTSTYSIGVNKSIFSMPFQQQYFHLEAVQKRKMSRWNEYISINHAQVGNDFDQLMQYDFGINPLFPIRNGLIGPIGMFNASRLSYQPTYKQTGMQWTPKGMDSAIDNGESSANEIINKSSFIAGIGYYSTTNLPFSISFTANKFKQVEFEYRQLLLLNRQNKLATSLQISNLRDHYPVKIQAIWRHLINPSIPEISWVNILSGSPSFFQLQTYLNRNQLSIGYHIRFQYTTKILTVGIGLQLAVFKSQSTSQKPNKLNLNQAKQNPIESTMTLPESTLSPSKISKISVLLNFELNEWLLDREDRNSLRPILEQLISDVDILITIIGHSDRHGTSNIKQEIAIRRAESVAAFFIDRGISSSRITTLGKSDTDPLSVTDDYINRRVEFILSK